MEKELIEKLLTKIVNLPSINFRIENSSQKILLVNHLPLVVVQVIMKMIVIVIAAQATNDILN